MLVIYNIYVNFHSIIIAILKFSYCPHFTVKETEPQEGYIIYLGFLAIKGLSLNSTTCRLSLEPEVFFATLSIESIH